VTPDNAIETGDIADAALVDDLLNVQMCVAAINQHLSTHDRTSASIAR